LLFIYLGCEDGTGDFFRNPMEIHTDLEPSRCRSVRCAFDRLIPLIVRKKRRGLS